MSEPSPAELPSAVRARVIALADETLASLAEEAVPASLRAVRRFTPAKRARLGAASLGAALESDPGFRAAVQARIRDGLPALADALDAGEALPAVAAVDVAAVAYLLQTTGWSQLVEAARPPAPAAAEPAEGERHDQQQAQLDAARRESKAEADRLRKELAAVRRETEELRRKLGRAEAAARRAGELQEAALQRAAAAQDERQALERELSAQIRRLRGRLRDAEEGAAAARRGERAGRDVHTARLRVLLDTVTQAAAGLRRELDLPAGVSHPADVIADDTTSAGPGTTAGLLSALRRGRSPEDPSVVDEMLALPGVHVIIDGYNVTKLGYPTHTLEEQRSRLLSGLAGLVARASDAEVTCVFDATAASARPVAVASPRGLRVMFSAVGELADELIIRLVSAEPAGRPVVVVTNDREVIDAARRSGADALASQALLRRLERS